MRVGEVGMDLRDQDECKAATIMGSISSTRMSLPFSNPDQMRGRDVPQAGRHRQRVKEA